MNWNWKVFGLILLIMVAPTIHHYGFMLYSMGFHDGETLFEQIRWLSPHGSPLAKLYFPLTLFGDHIFFRIMAMLPFLIFPTFFYVVLDRLDLAYLFMFIPYGFVNIGQYTQLLAIIFAFGALYFWHRENRAAVIICLVAAVFSHRFGIALSIIILLAALCAKYIKIRRFGYTLLLFGLFYLCLAIPFSGLLIFILNVGNVCVISYMLISLPILTFYLIASWKKEIKNEMQFYVLLGLFVGAVLIPIIYASEDVITNLHTGWRTLAMIDVFVLLFIGISNLKLDRALLVFPVTFGIMRFVIDLIGYGVI